MQTNHCSKAERYDSKDPKRNSHMLNASDKLDAPI